MAIQASAVLTCRLPSHAQSKGERAQTWVSLCDPFPRNELNNIEDGDQDKKGGDESLENLGFVQVRFLPL